jgi:hypothetical protein
MRIVVTQHPLRPVTPEAAEAMGLPLPPGMYDAVTTDEFYKPSPTWSRLRVDEVVEDGQRFLRIQWALQS